MTFETVRDELVWTVKFGLWKNRKLWPKKERPGEGTIDRMDTIAKHVVDHIEASRFKITKLPDKRSHETDCGTESPALPADER